MKKVDEGVEIFDEVWEKVYSAEQPNQKEKYEGDLKKEIKKLQRLRDQIKAWIGGTEVKDKEPLFEARRLIETKMEQFKICEKETKTKTYSKEGLARQERLSPEEQAKYETTSWIGDIIERLSGLVDEAEVEVEKLSSGKGKKTNKHLIDDFIFFIAQHKYHISKLEGIIRLVNNDVLDVDIVDPLKDDLEYYIDSYDDEDYVQAYDEDFFYEALGLDELDVVNVDRVTQATPPAVKEADNASHSTKDSKENKKSKKVVSSVIPLTIGRARVTSTSSKKGGEGEEERTPKKLEPVPTTIPAARPAPPPPVPGASMAAILKRETEQQEKERQLVSISYVRIIPFGDVATAAYHSNCILTTFPTSRRSSCDNNSCKRPSNSSNCCVSNRRLRLRLSYVNNRKLFGSNNNNSNSRKLRRSRWLFNSNSSSNNRKLSDSNSSNNSSSKHRRKPKRSKKHSSGNNSSKLRLKQPRPMLKRRFPPLGLVVLLVSICCKDLVVLLWMFQV